MKQSVKTLSLLALVFKVLSYPAAHADTSCKWCIADDKKIQKEFKALGLLEPKVLLEKVRADKVCVKVLRSNRKGESKFFQWSSVEPPQGELSAITKIGALMGKTLCADEHPMAKDCTTIVLAHDAPKSTLIHEYLHVRQIRRDSSWCDISKSLWNRKTASADERRAALDREWDAHKFLWKHKAEWKLSVEDRIGIAANLLEQATLRDAYDKSAIPYIKSEGVEKYLERRIADFQQAMRVNARNAQAKK
jgi:hypothetical protein